MQLLGLCRNMYAYGLAVHAWITESSLEWMESLDPESRRLVMRTMEYLEHGPCEKQSELRLLRTDDESLRQRFCHNLAVGNYQAVKSLYKLI